MEEYDILWKSKDAKSFGTVSCKIILEDGVGITITSWRYGYMTCINGPLSPVWIGADPEEKIEDDVKWPLKLEYARTAIAEGIWDVQEYNNYVHGVSGSTSWRNPDSSSCAFS